MTTVEEEKEIDELLCYNCLHFAFPNQCHRKEGLCQQYLTMTTERQEEQRRILNKAW